MQEDYGAGDYGLRTVSKEGVVPKQRMRGANHTQDFVRRLWDNDQKRAWLRSRVAGLIGGNPPFRNTKLRDANAADRCNVNWGTSRTYCESGSGSFYDLSSEAPGIVGIVTSYGINEQEKMLFSRIMSEEADRLIRDDKLFDYHMQQSQWEMTLYGCGPLWFEDKFKIFPRSSHCGDLKVPERTRADAEYFEVCSMDIDWYPPELYAFIKERHEAEEVGWDTEYTMMVIANALDIKQAEQRQFDYEYYQQEVKNNSLSYYDDSKICRCAAVFWREFDGRITQAIVERETNTPNVSWNQPRSSEEEDSGTKYLFIHVGRYENWAECMHPMYFDRGHGGYHHSVIGLGVKLYGAMTYENRLLCNLTDKAFAPDILFKPTTAEATQKFQLAHLSQYGLVPKGYDVIQTPVKGFVTDGLAMFRTTSELMRSNLSSYRQQAPMQKQGNPVTKFEKQLEAAQSSALSKTTFNRYYRQLDILYEEIVKRMCNLNSPDDRAKTYQKRCMEKGVRRECFGRIDNVKAVRVVGEGSAFLRRESVGSLMPIVSSMPEDGKINWMDDYIAANAGQQAVMRYNPRSQRKTGDEQDERAMNQVADMKVGVPPVITSSQNPLRFAGIFMTACTQAIQSVRQGADINTVMAFLDMAAPAAHAHINRILNDPLRQNVANQLLDQWKRIAAIADKLRRMAQQQQQKAKQQKQKTAASMTDEQIKTAKARSDMALKAAKAKQQLAINSAKTRQQLAIADMQAASDISGGGGLNSMTE
jgi:hypothetical protein